MHCEAQQMTCGACADKWQAGQDMHLACRAFCRSPYSTETFPETLFEVVFKGIQFLGIRFKLRAYLLCYGFGQGLKQVED
jgi:hypothetical protein